MKERQRDRYSTDQWKGKQVLHPVHSLTVDLVLIACGSVPGLPCPPRYIRSLNHHVPDITNNEAEDLIPKFVCKHSLATTIASLCDGQLAVSM